MGVPKLGEGGLPTWEFFPLNPVFISEGVPKCAGWVVTYLISGSLFASVNVLTRILMS